MLINVKLLLTELQASYDCYKKLLECRNTPSPGTHEYPYYMAWKDLYHKSYKNFLTWT